MVALFYVKKEKDARPLVLLTITIYCDEYCLNIPKTFKEIATLKYLLKYISVLLPLRFWDLCLEMV